MRSDNTKVNPYTDLIGIMREQGAAKNPPSLILGEVIRSSPLSVSAAGLQLDEDDLLLPDWYRSGTSRTISIDGTSKTIAFMTNGLGAGDILVILPMPDGQRFAVLGKVS